MYFRFNVDFHTSFGEDVVLNLVSGVCKDAPQSKFHMMTQDGIRWTCELNIHATDALVYYYDVERQGNTVCHEWTTVMHTLELNAAMGNHYTVYDKWHDIPEDSYLYSSAFTDCIRDSHMERPAKTTFGRTVRLAVRAPQLNNAKLAIVGEADALGNWQAVKARSMKQHAYNEWVVDLDAAWFADGKMEFKFVAVSDGDPTDTMWEEGYNRVVTLPALGEGDVVAYDLDQAFFAVYNTKVAGTLVPVFSLRTKESFGVGDFGDLRQMVDFMCATGQKVLQVLPINDSTITHTWTDSYPYSCISIFAIHPQYACLHKLPLLDDKGKREKYEKERRELNALPQIEYERVNNVKLAYLHDLYAQEGAKTLGTPAFKEFFKENAQWLVPYAQYCTLRDEYGTADFTMWKDHNLWDEADRKRLSEPRTKEYKAVAFWYYVQFVLGEQMKAVHEYARQHHVILKGDIPIGVNRYSCDVWTEPRYFNLNGQAGAPPDSFSTNGQTWGFPTYNWDEMIKDGCQWWVHRFGNMAKYFDAYRIDHVLGFFRIWEIPIDAVHGLLGQFAPALGMTADEIRGYGLNFQEERFTEPFITDWVLDRVFKERAAEVRDKYLDRIDSERYKMKPEYDTQKKIQKLFENVTDENELNFRQVPPTHFGAVRLHLREPVRQRQGCLQPPVQRLLLSPQQPVLVWRGHEEIACRSASHAHARVRRGPRHGARLRAMGDEPAAYSLAGDSIHAERPACALRPPLAQPLPLGVHLLNPRHADAQAVVGRGLGSHPGILQYHALSPGRRATPTAGMARSRHHIKTAHVAIHALRARHSRLARHGREVAPCRCRQGARQRAGNSALLLEVQDAPQHRGPHGQQGLRAKHQGSHTGKREINLH